MPTEPYVSVTISRESANPTEAEFDQLLLLVTGASFDEGELYRVYASAQEANEDADLDDVAKAMVSAVFAQDEHPPTVIVGALPTPADETLYRLTPTSGATTLGVTVIAPDGTETVCEGSGGTEDDALTALVSDIDGVTGLGCTKDSGTALVEPDGFGEHWRFKDFVGISRFADESPSLAYDDALTALAAEIDFYGVVIDVNSSANISEVAAWCLTNKKVFIAAPEILDPTDYTSTASALKAASNDRVLSLVKKAGLNEFAGCALAGLMRAQQPGSATYMYKTLRGVTADKWSTTHRTALVNAHCVLYVETAGEGMTTEGFAASGEYLDVIEGIDWLVARMEERVFGLLKSKKKVSYTDGGIATIASEVEGQLLNAEDPAVGILEPGSSSVSVPLKKDIPTSDRAQRRLNSLTFKGQLAGAIHYVSISGTVTV